MSVGTFVALVLNGMLTVTAVWLLMSESRWDTIGFAALFMGLLVLVLMLNIALVLARGGASDRARSESTRATSKRAA
jgi:amino acid permease